MASYHMSLDFTRRGKMDIYFTEPIPILAARYFLLSLLKGGAKKLKLSSFDGLEKY